MPIRFRCPTCIKLLSIARRKAGSVISCPKCGENVIVPELTEENTANELEGSYRNDLEQTLSVVATSSKRHLTLSQEAKSSITVNDPPLFEREDFQEMFSQLHAPSPAPLPQASEISASEIPVSQPKSKAVEVEQSFLVSRVTAYLFLGVTILLIGLAFGTGYLVGYSSRPDFQQSTHPVMNEAE